MTQMTDDIRAALDAIRLPDGQSLGASDRLSGLNVMSGRISLAIRIEPHEAQDFAALRRAVEQRLQALPGISSVFVVLTSDRGPAPAAPPKPSGKPDPLAGIGHVIA
ncbi:MAG: DUF59 domain-containing protein, partial [Rhodobacteraceae bacterium]